MFYRINDLKMFDKRFFARYAEGSISSGEYNMKFRKKPVIIEAVQFLPGEKYLKNIAQLASESSNRVDLLTMEGAYPQLFIETLEGRMEARVGDWVIKGVNGELYPCKPDIFEATYEKVDA